VGKEKKGRLELVLGEGKRGKNWRRCLCQGEGRGKSGEKKKKGATKKCRNAEERDGGMEKKGKTASKKKKGSREKEKKEKRKSKTTRLGTSAEGCQKTPGLRGGRGGRRKKNSRCRRTEKRVPPERERGKKEGGCRNGGSHNRGRVAIQLQGPSGDSTLGAKRLGDGVVGCFFCEWWVWGGCGGGGDGEIGVFKASFVGVGGDGWI